MTTETNGKNEERLLTAAERNLLRQIAAGEPPDSQRAQALRLTLPGLVGA